MLDVSRQAVAKWESGQSYPDISNLIALSEKFCVSVDHLVKDGDTCQTRLVAAPDCDYEELSRFLIEAKKKTYAGKGAEVTPSRPESHDLQYEDGKWLYIDTYLGGEYFSGEEAVWENHHPVYSMNYCGRVLSQEFVGDFLKEALLRVPLDKPYRGPSYYESGDYTYHCKVDGTIEWYQGYEEIYCGNRKIYECYFHGGLVK